MLEYWYLFPVSIIIATLANYIGVGGATFFSPLFMLVLHIRPEIAIGVALITEVFGFASGVSAYIKRKLIDYKMAVIALTATIPLAIIGSIFSHSINEIVLKTIFGVGLIILAISFIKFPDKDEVSDLNKAIAKTVNPQKTIITQQGEVISYTVCNMKQGVSIVGIGGLFVGLISTGLGEMSGYFFLQKCKIPSKVATATSVFIIAITVLAASVGHFMKFLDMGEETMSLVLNIVVFTIPGVIIGGQLGPMLTEKLHIKNYEVIIGILFLFIGVITIIEVGLG